MDLIIEGSPAELEWLRREIDRELGPAAEMEAIPVQGTEEFSEPLILALIVALGGKQIVVSISEVLQRRYQHKEEMALIDKEIREAEMKHEIDLAELQFKLRTDDGEDRPISERELTALEA